MDKNRKIKPVQNCSSRQPFIRIRSCRSCKSEPTVPLDDQESDHSIVSQDVIDKIIFLLPKYINKSNQTSPCLTPNDTFYNNDYLDTTCESFCITQDRKEKTLQEHIHKIINLSQDVLTKGIKNVDIPSYFKACDDVKKVIEDCRKKTCEHDGSENCFQCKLLQLKTRINEIINIAHVIDDKVSAPTAKSSTEINILSKCQSEDGGTISGISKKQKFLTKQIRKIEKVVQQCNNDGIITYGAEDFLKCCKRLKSQILTDENEVTCNINDMKKIPSGRQNINYNKQSSENAIVKLSSRIDETIELSKSAKKAGLISNSVDNLIKTCADSKQVLRSKSQLDDPVMLRELIRSIDVIMNMINDCRKDGLVTKSMECFFNNLMIAKAKINIVSLSAKQSRSCCEGIMIHPSNLEFCKCNQSYCLGPVLSKASKTSVDDKTTKSKQNSECAPIKTSASLNYAEPPCKKSTKTSKDVKHTKSEPCRACSKASYITMPHDISSSTETQTNTESYIRMPHNISFEKKSQKDTDNVKHSKSRLYKNTGNYITMPHNITMLESLEKTISYLTMPHNITPIVDTYTGSYIKMPHDISKKNTVSYCQLPHNKSPLLGAGNHITMPHNISMLESLEKTNSYITMPHNITPIIESQANTGNYIKMPHDISKKNTVNYYQLTLPQNKSPLLASHKTTASYLTMPNNLSPMPESYENTTSIITMPQNISTTSKSQGNVNSYLTMPRNISMSDEPGYIHCFSINYNETHQNPIPTTFYNPPCKTAESSSDDGILGYFETKVKKVTKITRTMNSDGTIREEKEIITTKSSKHNPNLTEIPDEVSDVIDGVTITEETVVEIPQEAIGNKMYIEHRTEFSEEEILPVENKTTTYKDAKNNIYFVIFDPSKAQRGFTRVLPQTQSASYPIDVGKLESSTKLYHSMCDINQQEIHK